MGTRSNPGQFDCYDKALPDEPVFVLLGRDADAIAAVTTWIAHRAPREGVTPKVLEAIDWITEADHFQRIQSVGRYEQSDDQG